MPQGQLSPNEFQAAFDAVAPRVAASARPGLSREEFNDLVIEEIERERGGGAEPSLMQRAIPTAMRIVPTVAGGFVGSLAGPLGTMAGGAAGGALGEYAAETYEQMTGQREDINPYQLATQTALGAIPMGRVAGSTIGQIAARRALQGAGMGGVSAGATEVAETGELPSVGNVAMGAALGGVLGGAAGNIEGRGLRRIGRLADADADVRPPAGLLPAGARFQADEAGRVGPMGADFPPGADPSFVRGVPAEYARRDIAGALPPGREPVITPAPKDAMYPTLADAEAAARQVDAPQGTLLEPIGHAGDEHGPWRIVWPEGFTPPLSGRDPSFARGVPAEYARHEIRGELPPGPRFVAAEHGVARAEDADTLRAGASSAAASTPETVSGGRLVPAATVARALDPTQDTGRAVRVQQYSGDPAAMDAPLVSDREREVLQLFRRDLGEFTSQRGRLVKTEDLNDSYYAHGGPGSPVWDDIRVISGTRAGNDSIARAIDDLIAGKPITNKLHVAALDAVRGHLEGRPGYRGPQLPMEAMEPGGVAAGAARAQAAGSGGEAVNDFEKFAAMLDEIQPSATREPGESGFIANQLLTRGGGALAGGAIGAATGDTPQERIENALLGATTGALVPSLAGGLRRRQPTAPGAPRTIDIGNLRPIGARGTQAPGTLPRASETVQGTPRRDPLAGTEVFIGKFAGNNPLLRAGIEERLTANLGYDVQRRGVLDNETVGRLAEQVRVDVSRVLPRGTAVNAEGVAAYTRAVKATMDRVRELSGRVASGSAGDADVLALAAAQADADVVLKSLMGARSEAGRALAMYRTFSALLDTGDVNLYRQAASGLREEQAEFAAQVARIGDPLQQYKFLQAQNRPALTDKMRSYFYSSILSGIKTHERNALGNAASILTRFASTPVTAALDAVQSAATGRPREVFVGELQPAAVGAVVGFQKGLRDFAFTLKHGVSPDALRRSVSAAVETGQLDIPRVEFGGGGANPFNWPGRMLDAADTLFRSTARNMELSASAYAKARKEGLRGDRLLARAAELRTDDALTAAAQKFAVESVFQQKPGKVTGALQAVVRSIPGAYFVVPFLKTPSNILKQGVQASPVGFVTEAGQQGGRAGVQAQGMAAMGSMLLAPLAWLAATNRLSGSGPRDPAERAALMESGWRPNSVRVGDQWFEYSLFQPVSLPAAVIANAYEAWRQGGAKEQDALNIATQVVARSMRSVLEQSYLSGLYDFMSAVEDPERFASQWAGRTAHSLTPFAGAQRTVTQATDPIIRRPETGGDVFRSNVPGLSRTVPARLTRFGEPAQRPGGGRSAFDALNVSPAIVDPVADELSRLGVSVALPTDRITLPGGATLDEAQSLQLRQDKGQQLRTQLLRIIGNPNYQRLPDALKRNALERVKDVSNRGANDATRRRVVVDQRRLRREALIRQMQQPEAQQ